MTHVVAGYPTIKKCKEIVNVMVDCGVSFIEVQFPFSDPIADGKTIEAANHVAIENGITTEKCFDLMIDLKKTIKIPLLIMTYYNIAFKYGLEKFCKKAHESGVYGLIIPDMPIDEEKYDHYFELCVKYKLHPIQIISPISSVERLKKISKNASGFVYCVSRTGTTGEGKNLDKNLIEYLKRVRKYIKVPIAVGFGISTKEHLEKLYGYADIAVMGSKIINIYNSGEEDVHAVEVFLKSLN